MTSDGAGGYTYAEVYAATAADAALGFSTGLLQGADGGLYAATYFPQGGVIYRVDPAGSFAVMHTFTGSEGAYPSTLVQSPAGDFYGVTSINPGTAFRMDTSGQVTVLHTFTPVEGGPSGPLLLASDGFFYGTCGSSGGHGTIFRMDSTGSLTVLHSFSGPDGSGPAGGLIEGSDGFLYGATSSGGDSGLGTVFRISTSGTLTTLHSLAANEGSWPQGKLLQASDGKFYGTTYDNGADPGTLFQIDSAGNFTTIHAFSSAEGIWPQGSLIEVGGKFVGSADRGGADGYGTAFTVTQLGTLAVVQSFAGPPEGNLPVAGLTQASDGLLYSTTCGAGDSGAGTLFRIDLVGNLTRLHSFDVSTEGSCPQAALIEASDGNLYGTAGSGGGGGHGTVFRSSTSGTITTLHAFSLADGDFPDHALVQATDGNFYGSTGNGGDSGRGTLFRVDGAGGFSLLHSISTTEGASPSGLVQGSDGAFYGSTAGGSLLGAMFFRMDTSGSITTLHAFGSDGNDANTPLIGSDGSFYAARVWTCIGWILRAISRPSIRSSTRTSSPIRASSSWTGWAPLGDRSQRRGALPRHCVSSRRERRPDDRAPVPRTRRRRSVRTAAARVGRSPVRHGRLRRPVPGRRRLPDRPRASDRHRECDARFGTGVRRHERHDLRRQFPAGRDRDDRLRGRDERRRLRRRRDHGHDAGPRRGCRVRRRRTQSRPLPRDAIAGMGRGCGRRRSFGSVPRRGDAALPQRRLRRLRRRAVLRGRVRDPRSDGRAPSD